MDTPRDGPYHRAADGGQSEATMAKLNSQRLLESQGIAYETRTYVYDPDDPPDAVAVAAQIGLEAGRVFKTIVLGGASGGRPVLVMLPADRQLDLKRCAAAAGQKRLGLLPRAETERVTGLKVGGIGALALVQRRWATFLDRAAAEYDLVYVNAGQRGIMLGVGVADLVRATGAQVVEVSAP